MQTLTASGEPGWLRSLFETIDAADAGGFCGYLTEDAIFRFGSATPVQGRAAIERAVTQFFASIRRSRHQLLRVWPADGAIALEGVVTYTRLDGRDVTLPFADTLVLRRDRIAEYSIYIDIAPLYAPAPGSQQMRGSGSSSSSSR
jgi:ketosteroid isomerase-like protein